MWIIRVGAALAVLVSGWGCASAPAPAPKEAPKVDASFNVGSIFPAGEGRELVMSTCGNCHTVVCSARGQRTAERWESIRKSHVDKLSGHSPANIASMFTYLKANFNETKPEPTVPAALAEQGCTPF